MEVKYFSDLLKVCRKLVLFHDMEMHNNEHDFEFHFGTLFLINNVIEYL